MNRKAFLRLLQSKGVKVREGGKHTILTYGDKQTILSRSSTIEDKYKKIIFKQLDIQ